MEDDRVNLFNDLFEKALEEIRMEDYRSQYAKGSLMQRRKTYGKAKKNVYYMKNS